MVKKDRVGEAIRGAPVVAHVRLFVGLEDCLVRVLGKIVALVFALGFFL